MIVNLLEQLDLQNGGNGSPNVVTSGGSWIPVAFDGFIDGLGNGFPNPIIINLIDDDPIVDFNDLPHGKYIFEYTVDNHVSCRIEQSTLTVDLLETPNVVDLTDDIVCASCGIIDFNDTSTTYIANVLNSSNANSFLFNYYDYSTSTNYTAADLNYEWKLNGVTVSQGIGIDTYILANTSINTSIEVIVSLPNAFSPTCFDAQIAAINYIDTCSGSILSNYTFCGVSGEVIDLNAELVITPPYPTSLAEWKLNDGAGFLYYDDYDNNPTYTIPNPIISPISFGIFVETPECGVKAATSTIIIVDGIVNLTDDDDLAIIGLCYDCGITNIDDDFLFTATYIENGITINPNQLTYSWFIQLGATLTEIIDDQLNQPTFAVNPNDYQNQEIDAVIVEIQYNGCTKMELIAITSENICAGVIQNLTLCYEGTSIIYNLNQLFTQFPSSTSFQWQYRVLGNPNTTWLNFQSVGTSSNFTFNLIETYEFRVFGTVGSCSTASNIAVITIESPPENIESIAVCGNSGGFNLKSSYEALYGNTINNPTITWSIIAFTSHDGISTNVNDLLINGTTISLSQATLPTDISSFGDNPLIDKLTEGVQLTFKAVDSGVCPTSHILESTIITVDYLIEQECDDEPTSITGFKYPSNLTYIRNWEIDGVTIPSTNLNQNLISGTHDYQLSLTETISGVTCSGVIVTLCDKVRNGDVVSNLFQTDVVSEDIQGPSFGNIEIESMSYCGKNTSSNGGTVVNAFTYINIAGADFNTTLIDYLNIHVGFMGLNSQQTLEFLPPIGNEILVDVGAGIRHRGFRGKSNGIFSVTLAFSDASFNPKYRMQFGANSDGVALAYVFAVGSNTPVEMTLANEALVHSIMNVPLGYHPLNLALGYSPINTNEC